MQKTAEKIKQELMTSWSHHIIGVHRTLTSSLPTLHWS
jgi:hypothetical protein